MIALLSELHNPTGRAAVRQVLRGVSRPSIGYIASEPDPQWRYFEPVREIYRQMGAKAVHYLELEAGYDPDVARQMMDCDLIHLCGGNTFRYLDGLQRRELLPELRAFAERGRALVGVSAGAMVLTPSIESAHLCGDRNEVGLADTGAADVVPFQFVPHASVTSESEALELARRLSYPAVLCDDDSAILMQGNDILPMGHPRWIAAPAFTT
ncbi:Type 1 glutamine amidotransferase-like domain-containing protein [Marinobacter hydrocarbonoclasticus]|nr:Type 1 glutamine amidotransferase-like domain-containing protein [Marinobacter nauticus]